VVLVASIRALKLHGGLNKFSKDTQSEIDLVVQIAKENGAFDAVLTENWEKGGEGGAQLAQAVVNATNQENKKEFKFLYELNEPIEEKIRAIAQKIYSAQDIKLSELAQKKIDILKKQVNFYMFFKKINNTKL